MKLYICNKRGKYVVVDYDDNRKQLAKYADHKLAKQFVKNKLAEELQLKNNQIIAKGKRYKFKEEYKAFAEYWVSLGKDPTVRMSFRSVQGYMSHWHNYIEPYFEDLYLDEVTEDEFVKFLVKVKQAGTYKVCKDLTTKVKKFLRKAISQGKILNHPILAFKAPDCQEIQPETDEEKFEKQTRAITKEEVTKLHNYLFLKKDNSDYDATRYALVALFSYLGLRRSELLGLRKCNVFLDVKKPYIEIKATFDYEVGLRHRVKNRGSKRSIYLTPKQYQFFKWWMSYLDENSPYNQYILPAVNSSGSGPMSHKAMMKYLWTAFSEVGLATIKLSEKGDWVTVIDSPFKGCVTKTFRHFVASSLVSKMKLYNLDKNYVMQRVGHTRWQTTESTYGNKLIDEDYENTISNTSKALDY